MASMRFLIVGVFVAIALWVLQRRKIGPRVKILLAIVSTVGLVGLLAILAEGNFLGATAWYDRSPYKEICFLLFMLVGMVVRYLASAIEERRATIKEFEKNGQRDAKVKLRFDAWEFSYPLLFSVVTFGGLLTQIKDGNISAANLILSFQNGFFWQSLLKKSVTPE
jgi:hypothetical protein